MIHTGGRHRNGHHFYDVLNNGRLQRSFSQMRPQRQPKSRQYCPSQQNGSSSPACHPANGASPTVSTSSELSLIVMGDERVGKSALVSQFLWSFFPEDYRPTVEEFNWVEYEIGTGGDLMLQVIDSGGSHDFLAMRTLYAKTGDAFMVVFAADSDASFAEARQIIQEIREENKKRAPILLVGNKTDLVAPDWRDSAVDEYCLSMNIDLVTLSAKDGQRVAALFSGLIDKLKTDRISAEQQLRKRRQSMPSRRACSNIDIDVDELQRIAKKHHHKRDNCCIS